MGTRRLCSSLVLLAMLVAAPGASAKTWTAEPMAVPQVAQGQLFSVSCGAPNRCEAVGQTVDARGNTKALAEQWNGSTWTRQSITSIDGPSTYLSSVSCTGRDACLAVGSDATNTGNGMVAERWNGHTWTLQVVPAPKDELGVLNSVSCGSADSCTAVGFEFSNVTGQQLPLIEVWNGSGWSTQPSPALPPGAVAGALASVSCPASSDCTTVGSDYGSTGYELPLVLSRRGGTWQTETIPTPSISEQTLLESVSCSAANACTAVGTFLTQDGQLGLAERFNGTTWSIQSVPSPSTEPVEALAGVSCPSATSCVAVGGATSFATGATGTVAARWNGAAWALQSGPTEPGGFLNSVSCTGPTSCVAVGSPGSGATAALARPKAGTIPRPGLLAGVASPAGAGSRVFAPLRARKASASLYRRPAGLNQLAARRRAARRAHRASAASQTSLALAERWTGSDWRLTPTPAITGAAAGQVFGVSCASSSDCFATGSWFDSSGAEVPLLEHWDGTSWSIQSIPGPTGVLGARLFDVSCTAANACSAVGEAFTLTSELAFAEQWDGTSWTLESTPADGRLGTALGSVSCTAASACTAVGALLNNEHGTLATLIEAWNGTSWSIDPSVNDPGNTSSSLYGVSCTGSVCMAVGDWNSNVSDGVGVLSELGTGTTWTLEAVPAPGFANVGLPSPVSCTSANACTTVGSWFGLNGGGAFADRWDGTAWTPQVPPSSLFELNGVACATGTSCLAVDDGMSALWDGNAWSAQPLASPADSLSGISCPTTGDCTAVGTGFTSQPEPVAERYS